MPEGDYFCVTCWKNKQQQFKDPFIQYDMSQLALENSYKHYHKTIHFDLKIDPEIQNCLKVLQI